ncbi:hydroxylase [Rhodococcus rhodochrous]|uniref:3-hydroxy-9,10-secoandrosta-1,3,5(10)-triene-9, 17-dione monooxygenase oxygenase subunit n=1 Tax=Rhodococcus TaxID=1827 RepID=UPI00075132A7|nr:MULTISPECIES: 3-hydroxy-9,10-secoandrosta-1,3,5(10)-triene-9,17-dione monooxygenase oxygenase subunit [Rhodococcus]MDC3725830.1 acyl-CoA dehydrogenase family protein [Rhodococcus sp. Rp3]MDJ0399323.1 acyl-CoA dehydrogenase family protein [Rhodococcus rhodochrous]MDO1484401.1 flavin-dependent monooxygenase [Rhodococcus rhodochrous]SNV11606.1 hydroxylase [Rhodococcus rhodochrous]
MTADDVLDAVRDLIPGIAARAAETDRLGRVPDGTVRELVAAGVFRMLQPRRYGGFETEPARFFEVVRTISAACGSTGWIASVVGVHPWHLALFHDRAQREVWGEDDSTLVSSAYAPVGRLIPVDDGYRLSGTWMFSSGCRFASWALLGAVVVGSEGRPVDFVTVLVPRSDYTIRDVWNVVGMRGTSSDEIVVDDVFVPDHRVKSNYETSQLRGPGRKVNTGPLYRLPFAALFTTSVAVPVVGVVAGCYDEYLSSMRERVRLSLGGGRFVDDPFAQVAVGRVASDIDAATLQLDRNIRELWELAKAGRQIPMQLRLRTRRDQVRATERAVEAIDLLFRTAGGTSLFLGGVVERAWRDAHAGSVHVANEPERAYALYGRDAFGLPVEDNLI